MRIVVRPPNTGISHRPAQAMISYGGTAHNRPLKDVYSDVNAMIKKLDVPRNVDVRGTQKIVLSPA